MHRKITSGDVEGYATHMPTEEVELVKDEDLVFKKGLLTKASGTTSAKLMPQVRFMCGCCYFRIWFKVNILFGATGK